MKYLILLLFIPATLFAQSNNKNVLTTGPENGSLIIAGGGKLGPEIIDKFIQLAGGPDAAIVFIPTAGDKNNYGENYRGTNMFRDRGAKNITVLHTRDKRIADSDEFTATLSKAKAVWFSGGRQWRLVDAYKDTKTERLIQQVLDRGGVIGGSSAGATIQGSYLARGDTRNNQIMMGDHEQGFAYIKNIAIDQHVIARNRHFDMFNILEKRPELLGLSIDEGTAILVEGNEFEVLGKSYVIIFDGSFWSREGTDLKNLPTKDLFYFLRKGDRYNIKERKVVLKN